MRIPPLPLVEKAAGMSIEDKLPLVLRQGIDLETMLEFCTAYRRIGICQLLMTSLPDELFAYLSMSAHAFLFFLKGQSEDAMCTGRAEPFLDALACGDTSVARDLIGVSRRTWNPDAEYEEDFLYFTALMELLSAAPVSQLEPVLLRYERLTEGQEDLHLELCRALCSRSSTDFDVALGAYLEQKYQSYRKGLSVGAVFPYDAATTERVCVEGMALVWLARHLGMKPRPGELLLPSPALLFSRAHLPAPDAWKQLESFRELD